MTAAATTRRADFAVEPDDLRAAVDRIGYWIAPLERPEPADPAAAWRRRALLAMPLALATVALAMWPGLLNPMLAGATMALSSVSVVSNSLRLRRFGQ